MNMDNLDQGTLGEDVQAAGRRRKRGWWSRNWRWFVPVLLLAVIVVGGGGAYWGLFLRVYGLKECKAAMQAIRADKELEKSLGKPIEPVYWPSQEAAPSANIDQNRVDIRWTIEGPKGRAKAHTLVERRQGEWQTVILEVVLADGKKIAVGDEASGEVAPPFGGNVAPPFGGPKTEAKKPETNAPPPEINLPAPPADTPEKP